MPCNACTTARSPASSRSRTAASSPSRPVNPGLRAGMFHTRGTLPGGSGPEPRRACGQLPQRPFHQLAELVRAGEGLRDQPAGLHPAAERLLPGPELVVDQLVQRDPHIGGGGIEQEHQPRQPGRGGGVELQLGIGHLRLVPHRRAVPGAQHPHIHLQPRTRSAHTCAAGWSAAGKSAISTITCPAAEIARSASVTYDVPPRGSSAAQTYATGTPATGTIARTIQASRASHAPHPWRLRTRHPKPSHPGPPIPRKLQRPHQTAAGL